jgi:protein-tyrosine phosphatase
VPAAVYQPMLDVRAEYLNSGFDEVEEAYGSFAAYERKASAWTPGSCAR